MKVNAVLAQINGLPAAAHVGQTLEAVAPVIAPLVAPSARHVLDTGECTGNITFRALSGAGVPRVWSVTFHPACGPDGELFGVHFVVHDITDRVASDEALLDRLAFEQFVTDLSARFVNVPANQVEAEIGHALRRLVEFLGVDRGTFARLTPELGVHVISSYARPEATAAVPSGPLSRALRWYADQLLTGNVVRFASPEDLPPEATDEHAYCAATGLWAHLGIPIAVAGMSRCALGVATFHRTHAFRDEAVSRLRLVGEVFANALARRDAEAGLRRIQAELSHVTRVSTVGQLASSIAHEINQPLTAIVSNAQAAQRLLSADVPDVDEVRAALADIAADARRAGDVVLKSHGLMKKRDAEFKPTAVNDVVRDVAALLHSEAVIRHVELRAELATDPSPPPVAGDRVQLQQVVLNLIVNALDATAEVPQGGPRRVVARTECADDGVRVVVDDTGAGLAPDVASRMFEPFFTTKCNGLGMGLAINRTIIEAHGGSVWAGRNADGGASVGFSLPCHAAGGEARAQ